MIVRVVVHLENRALVRHLVHATRHEPVAVDAAQGMMAFDVPFCRVEAVVNRLAESGVAEFLAHVTPTPESKMTDSGEEG
jgi:hypothetical protein